jgi:hypothetical protein
LKSSTVEYVLARISFELQEEAEKKKKDFTVTNIILHVGAAIRQFVPVSHVFE